MIFTPLPLKGASLIDLEKIEDERGFFSRYYCEKEFADQGLEKTWVQINLSLSRKKGTLRGLHFQHPPKAEAKIVRCLRGAIWDVIVDIRANSSTFGKWVGKELNDENRTMMYVPKGFAHGFLSLEKNSEILYLVSEFYSEKYETGLIWNDSDININWPFEPLEISKKDLQGKLIKDIHPLVIR